MMLMMPHISNWAHRRSMLPDAPTASANPPPPLFTHCMGSFRPSMSRWVSNFVPTRMGSRPLPSLTADLVPAHPVWQHSTTTFLTHSPACVDRPAAACWGCPW